MNITMVVTSIDVFILILAIIMIMHQCTFSFGCSNQKGSGRNHSDKAMLYFVFLWQGVLCRTLQGHGHWVNTMALSTDYILRTGAFDPSDRTIEPAGIKGMSCE